MKTEEQEREREVPSELIEQTAYAGPISTGLLTSLCLDCLAQQVRGYWTAARLHACLLRLRRFCASSPRRRMHQEMVLRVAGSATRTSEDAGHTARVIAEVRAYRSFSLECLDTGFGLI